jgi:hypothetical protein
MFKWRENVQVLQHLGDLESFCTRVQVVLQQEERKKVESITAKRRTTSDGGGEGEEEEPGDKDATEVGEVNYAGKEVQSSAAINSSKVAANAPVKVVPELPAIILPDIRDDDDAYFGDAAEVPMELSALRQQVKHARQRRPALAHVVQVLSPLI